MKQLFTTDNPDYHLNIFWQYSGNPYLENNITKAFINTLNSMEADQVILFITRLLKLEAPDKACKYKINYHLQQKPPVEMILSFDEDKRILLAFSPTGKCWGYDGIDTNDAEKIKDSIRSSFKAQYPNASDLEIDKTVNDEYEVVRALIEHRGESVPDGWIMIYADEKPYLCVALENKLYDLNPFQLKNHIEKSLLLTDGVIYYSKYMDIINELSAGFDGYVIDEFLRYMYFLGYHRVDNLKELPEYNDDRVLESIVSKRLVPILDHIGKAEWHKGWMWMTKLNSPYDILKQVGIYYDYKKKQISVMMYFAPTQRSAKVFWEIIKSNGFCVSDKYYTRQSFHTQSTYGKNQAWSYIDCADTNAYIKFWCNNTALLKRSDKNDCKRLYQIMRDNDLISDLEYNRICESINQTRITSFSICPELLVQYSISLEEAIELDGKHKLEQCVSDAITNACAGLNIGKITFSNHKKGE